MNGGSDLFVLDNPFFFFRSEADELRPRSTNFGGLMRISICFFRLLSFVKNLWLGMRFAWMGLTRA